MQLHDGFYIPEGEVVWANEYLATYQQEDREAAYEKVRSWRTAIDLGANIGLFTRPFATRFERVYAFEPMPATRECLEQNVPENVIVMPFAVTDVNDERLQMVKVTKGSGAAYIHGREGILSPTGIAPSPGKLIEVATRTIDSFAFDDVDLIKLDVQGAEYLALKGAEQTILRSRPVILIEEKPRKGDAADALASKRASDYLLSLGMQLGERRRADRVYFF